MHSMPEFADPFQVFKSMRGPGRLLCFDGLPGSGRTFVAALTAVYFAECGYRTLLISAEQPAWLSHCLGRLSSTIEPVESVSDLWAFGPALPEDFFTRDLMLLVHLAFQLDGAYDFVILDRTPGGGAVSHVATACRKWERIIPPSFADMSNVVFPSERQWGLLLPRLWEAEVTRFVAVASPAGFERDRFLGKLEETVATGMTPGLIVANRLPVTRADQEAPAQIRDFLREIFEAGNRYNCAVADMALVDGKGIGHLSALRRSAQVFFRSGSELGRFE